MRRVSVRWAPGRALAPAVVFVVALVARVTTVLFGGGYQGYFNYDSSVYYNAAAALLHGRLPYRDFVLVHPPGSALLLSPFAAVGALTDDHIGYTSANIAASVMGALAAALVVLVVREIVPSRVAAWTAGLAYAVYPGAVLAEVEARLEPMGNVLLLLGLWCLLRLPGRSWRWAAIGGAALAAAVSVKIWYVVPAAVVALLLLAPARRSRWWVALAGMGVAAAVIDLPFFLVAPRAMYRAVILAQLGRAPQTSADLLVRTSQASGLPLFDRGHPLHHTTAVMAAVGAAVVLLLVLALAGSRRGGRIPALMLLAQLIVLLRAPSYYTFYLDYLAPAAAVCLGIGLGVVAERVMRRRRSGRTSPELWRRGNLTVIAAGAVAVIVGLAASPVTVSGFYPAAAFRPVVAHRRCVMSNTPGVLIQLDALNPGLAHGCPNWVDFYGRRLLPRHYRTHLQKVAAVQRASARYLLSGDAVALLDGQTVPMDTQLERVLGYAPILIRRGRFCIVAVGPRQRAEYRDKTRLPRLSPPGATARERAAAVPWCAGRRAPSRG